ncbi:dihydroorotate dehydrogenase [Tabrizicola sp. BL-A-41-H6]|uniref:dihydroorotate dehydrogenase n=1 Tax=Tabrizicola sp. BL-A-41-H6 TaxID=3421107 RepID=UPI003D67C954
MQHDDIDDLFADLRTAAPAPSEALIDRVLADALREQPKPAPLAPQRTVDRWSQLIRRLGGVPTLAGVTAAVVGMAVGYADPTMVDALAGGLSSYSIGDADLFPAADFLVTEG